MLLELRRQIGTGVRRSSTAGTLPVVLLEAVALCMFVRTVDAASSARPYVHPGDWQGSVIAVRQQLRAGQMNQNAAAALLQERWAEMEREFPVQCDWVLQDFGSDSHAWLSGKLEAEDLARVSARILEELAADGGELSTDLSRLRDNHVAGDDRRWLDHYVNLCEQRRRLRLRPLVSRCGKIVFTKHLNIGGSHYAYTEAQSDAQDERNFVPGTALCILEMDSLYGTVHTLIEDKRGVIRDPDVSYDGKRILFSWKKSDREDDYHLYEMDVETRDVRQLTFGAGLADYEGAYLPNDNIVFNSTRCVQIVDCWWTEVSNLYTCDANGKFLRRLTFDQVHTNFPTVTHDGRVIYTRWDYNDRAQIYPQGLFQMYPDGTAQTAVYANSSWFPTTVLHARGIPGTDKIVAVLSGHHTHQRGKLAIIDTRKGREEASGVEFIAPVRRAEAVRVDAYGQDGEQFQYPYPLDEDTFLVTYDPHGSPNKRYDRSYGVYLMTIDGRRELLAWDHTISCNQPVPLAPRRRPHLRPSLVDYREDTGTYYLQDVYVGHSMSGVPRGTVKELRVVALDFRAAGIGRTPNSGPGGGALASTPVGVGNTSWDVKVVLGQTRVYEDGSALFAVPARTPVYFQAVDAEGHVVQTMRSWSTLQPGETYSCVGCHEQKNQTPSSRPETLAMKAGVKPLEPFSGPPRGFSFTREIQPILDRHCISCHNGDPNCPPSLLGRQIVDSVAKRRWSESYLALTDAQPGDGAYKGNADGGVVNWISNMSVPTILPPYSGGSARSRLVTMLEQKHEGVELSRQELNTIACWIDLVVPYCGDYIEANAWSEVEMQKYRHYFNKRLRMQDTERENIEALLRENENLQTARREY